MSDFIKISKWACYLLQYSREDFLQTEVTKNNFLKDLRVKKDEDMILL